MVGMGSVVTRSVSDFHLVIGNPARSIGCCCRCGEVLLKWRDDSSADGEPREVPCKACGLRYEIEDREVRELMPVAELQP